MSTYEVKVTNEYGAYIYRNLEFVRLRYVSQLNTIGYFEVTFNASAYPHGLFELDHRVEVWRSPMGYAPRLAFVGFMRLYKEVGQDYTYTHDYRGEQNYIYIGGKGQESARVLTNISDAASISLSLINLREGFTELTTETDTTTLQDKGREELYTNRYKETFEQDLQQGKNSVYMLDWDIGDEVKLSGGRPTQITIGGPDLNDLLDRRIVAYATGTSQAKKNDYADDMLKAYVYENMGAGATSARQFNSALGFTIASDISKASTIKHSASYDNIFDVCQEIAEKASNKGDKLRFSVIPLFSSGRVTPHLKTTVTRWGADKTGAVVFGDGPLNQSAEIIGVDVTVSANGAEVVKPITESNS